MVQQIRRKRMVFRLNFVVTSLCMAIGLSSSGASAVKVKSQPIRSIQSQPLEVISTGNIAIQATDSTYIHPHKTTSCVIARATEHRVVHCRGEKQKTGLTLTSSTLAQHLAVETGSTTWIRDKAN
ncbi:hypothetical protein, partial [Sansalvadorimonas verongulae]|uniref:hypothetical protein n=1 Tax=Sansalvadorimonas verongulae TaxID=2172824 RepID=UPI001E470482